MTADEEYLFRSSPLRDVALTALYFHSGVVWSLETVLQAMAESQLGDEGTDEEADQIVAFLESLTGEVPETERPILPPETERAPRPTVEIVPD